jgi:hypothetical protein
MKVLSPAYDLIKDFAGLILIHSLLFDNVIEQLPLL